MEKQRTPDERFENLPDYPFAPNYLNIDDTDGGELRVHYLDEGSRDGRVVLLMHGQPVWSYLYRYMIPPLVAAGFRVLVPDLVGFGKSDKPTQQSDYTYANHVAWMSDWLSQIGISDITLFCQDWGSLIGLRLVSAFPERFAGVVLANGGLPIGTIPPEQSEKLKAAYLTLPVVEAHELGAKFKDTTGIPGFLYWRKFCTESPTLDVGQVVQTTAAGSRKNEGSLRAYRAPFPDDSYMAGVRRFPSLVPVFHDEPGVTENKAAWEVLKTFEKPFMCAFSDRDPVTAGADKPFRKLVPGCKDVAHRTIRNAGHFLQQDQPEECVQAILDIVDYY